VRGENLRRKGINECNRIKFRGGLNIKKKGKGKARGEKGGGGGEEQIMSNAQIARHPTRHARTRAGQNGRKKRREGKKNKQ